MRWNQKVENTCSHAGRARGGRTRGVLRHRDEKGDRIEGSGAASLISQHLAGIKRLFCAGWAGRDPQGPRRTALFQSWGIKDSTLGHGASEEEQRNANTTKPWAGVYRISIKCLWGGHWRRFRLIHLDTCKYTEICLPASFTLSSINGYTRFVSDHATATPEYTPEIMKFINNKVKAEMFKKKTI